MLAEKYRPRTFADVIGQDKVIQAVRWYLDQPTESGKAFLFTGPSGSGKTTLAECAARHWGIVDYDMHRIESAECSVDALRQVASDMMLCGWGPTGRKLYVIDEIHTVTGRAADRLLSLLETLPSHVLVVGTTTESDWTDGILLSRWVRFELAKVRSTDVAAHLADIAQREGLPIPPDPKWADKLVKYFGLNMRDHLNQLPARLFGGATVAA
jgi:DNA polymerase-3 subunit gamma/tau